MRPLHEEFAQIADKRWYVHGIFDALCKRNWHHLWGSKLTDRNIDCRVVKLPSGLRIAGLSGAFWESIWYPNLPTPPNFRNRKEHVRATPKQNRWHDSVQRKHCSTIYPNELDRLPGMRADILLTHEAPSYHRYGFESLDTLAQSLGTKVTAHGHLYDRLDSSDRWHQLALKKCLVLEVT